MGGHLVVRGIALREGGFADQGVGLLIQVELEVVAEQQVEEGCLLTS